VNANAPVCVASDCSGRSTIQGSSAGSSASSSSGNGGPANQQTTHSIGTAQLGGADVNPAAALSLPVNGNAPVCVLSYCTGGSVQQGSGGGSNAATGSNGGSANQQTTHSIGTAQLGGADVNPAAALSLPVNGNAPVCVLSYCTGGSVQQGSSGGSNAATGSNGSGANPQTTTHSIGTAQLGGADVNPAAAASLPINGNAPVCVLSNCTSSSTNHGSNGGSNAATGSNGGGSPGQSAGGSVGTVQLTAGSASPVVTANGPVTGTVCAFARCLSGQTTQTNQTTNGQAGSAIATGSPATGGSATSSTATNSGPSAGKDAGKPVTTSPGNTGTHTPAAGTTPARLATASTRASKRLPRLTPTISLKQIPSPSRGLLPFTGFALWLALLTALGLSAGGLCLRRLGKEVIAR